MTAFDKAWTVLKGYSDINWKNMGMDFGNDITWGVDEMCRNCGKETEEVHTRVISMMAFNKAWRLLKMNNKQNQGQRRQWEKRQIAEMQRRQEDKEAQRLLEEQKRKEAEEESAARYEAEALAAAEAAMAGYQE